MKGFPVVLNMENKTVLLVGGGKGAMIKLRSLAEYKIYIRLIAPDFLEDVKITAEKNGFVMIKRNFVPQDLQGIDLVLAAASNEVNEYVYKETKKRGILCYTADGKGDFMLPAHKTVGDLTVTVSTNGKYPLLAKKICGEVDFSYAEYLDNLEKYRHWVLKNVPEKEKSTRILTEMMEFAGREEKILKCIGRNFSMHKKIKIGTRASQLAIRQSELVKEELLALWPDLEVEIVTIKTKGDKILNKTLDKIGGKGLFVKEIEMALLENTIDIAVHSMKDMPDEMHEDLTLMAVLKRENPMDILVCNNGVRLEELPLGAKIGTGSLRRKFQLLALRPDLQVEPIRGNIETRMRKLEEGFDGVVLAAAGLLRSGYHDKIAYEFDLQEMVPAACQGILAVQGRKNDIECKALFVDLNDSDADICQKAERAFLKGVGADCHSPAGALAWEENGLLKMKAMFYTDRLLVVQGSAAIQEAEKLGLSLAEKILHVEEDTK